MAFEGAHWSPYFINKCFDAKDAFKGGRSRKNVHSSALGHRLSRSRRLHQERSRQSVDATIGVSDRQAKSVILRSA